MNPHELTKGKTYLYDKLKGDREVVFRYATVNHYAFQVGDTTVYLSFETVRKHVTLIFIHIDKNFK